MTDSERLRILAEARANLADREPATENFKSEKFSDLPPLPVAPAPWTGVVDSEPVERWKAEGLAAASARARAARERKREEQAHVARQAEQPAVDWAAIDRRVERLVEARVQAAIKAILEAVGMISEDINRAIGSSLDQVDARLASLEQLLNKRAGRSVAINDEQSPRRVN